MGPAGTSVAAAVLAAAAVGLAAYGAGAGRATAVSRTASVRAGALVFAVPPGFNQYDIRGGLYKTGTLPPVIGHVIADYQVGARSPLRSGVFPMSQPERKVAFELQLWEALGVIAPSGIRLHLPLSLHEPWFHERVRAGLRRYGYLRFKRHLYELLVWTGRRATPRDRDALVGALASVHPAH